MEHECQHKETISELVDSNRRMELALLGDDQMGIVGMVTRIKNIERAVQPIVALCTIVGIMIGLLKDFIPGINR